ncbi:MAG: alkaline phosphatase D family protein [Solirubrobacterales bacterium]
MIATAIFASPAAAAVGGFQYGVTAGEVTSSSAVLWAKTKKSGRVTAEVATDGKFKKVVAKAKTKAKGSNDNTVQAEIDGLKAGQALNYRFCEKNGPCSDKGKFTTAPKASKAETIEFAYTGDTDATAAQGSTSPFFGTFEAFKAMQKEDNDFNVHMGDTIYSDSEVAGAPPALTVEEKWAKYRLNLEQKNYPKLRGSAAYYTNWDDHEFINDFSIPEDGEALYQAGVKAFTDYAPVDYSEDDGLYRTFKWGKNLELFILDERSFRSAKASDQCINPASGAPDLAPTAPESKRQLFSSLIPSLSQPVSQLCKDTINSSQRTLLGQPQFNQFLADIEKSSAKWKVVLNETPIQQFYGLPFDRWEGYAFERIALLNALEAANTQNLVFLTTDTHAAFANVIRTRTFADDVAPPNAAALPHDTPWNDYIIGPVATNTFWTEIDSTTNSPGAGKLLSQAFFKPPPPDGVGMFCAQGDVNSYGEITVSGSKLVVDYKDEKGQPVLDVDGQPCGPYTVPAQ